MTAATSTMKGMQKYELKGLVGEGAYGKVFMARNKETGEVVAIKKFKEADDDEIVKKTTMREVKMLRQLRQENIVYLHECFKKCNRLYLVFEYLEKNLLEVLEENPNGIELDQVCHYIYQLLKAIEYCHRKDVIHRDIKPENLLIHPKSNKLKICDFGFARQVNKPGAQLSDYVATRWYRAPELLLSNQYGKEVDIWAIGCIMGEITDGDALFPGESEIDQLFCIQKILGKLTPHQQELFNKNPRFVGLQFPSKSKPETLERRYMGKMTPEAIQCLKGMLTLDPDERLTAAEALAEPWFDNLREPEVEQLIQADRQRKAQKAANAESNQYSNLPTEGDRKRRGESSKSRASMRSNHNGQSLQEQSQMAQIGAVNQMGQLTQGMANMGLMSGGGAPDLRNQSKYNTKFSQGGKSGQEVKNTPQHMISSKIGMKQGHRSDQQSMQFSQGSSGMNQYAGNLQQPYPNKYQSKSVNRVLSCRNQLFVDVHSSQVGKKSVNAQGVYGSEAITLRVGKERSTQDRESSLNERQGQRESSNNGGGSSFHPQTNNFIPSSNLSQFLLKKGSNGSLHTFENEYSYKINLENLNSNMKGPSQTNANSSENNRSGQSGPQSIGKKNLNKKNHLFKEVIVEDEAEDLRGSQLGSDAQVNFQMMGSSYNGGPSALGRSNQTLAKKGSQGQWTAERNEQFMSMNRDSNSPTPQRNGNKMVINQGIKLPVQIKSITSGINKLQRDSIGENNQSSGNNTGTDGMIGMMQQTPNFYEFPTGSKQNQQEGVNNLGMPGNSYDNQMNRFSPKVSLGQDINTVFASGTSNQSGQFQALNNKLKSKKQHHQQMLTQNSQNSQQMLNPRAGGGISNFMQSYNNQQMMQQQHGHPQFGQATGGPSQSISNSHNQYEYSIPGDAIYSSSNLSQFKN